MWYHSVRLVHYCNLTHYFQPLKVRLVYKIILLIGQTIIVGALVVGLKRVLVKSPGRASRTSAKRQLSNNRQKEVRKL